MVKFEDMKYSRPSLKKMTAKFEKIYDEFINAQNFEQQNNALKKYFKWSDQINSDATIISILYSIDTTNEKYQKDQDLIDEISPYVASLDNKFSKALLNAKFREDLEKKWGNYLFKMLEISLKCFDEKIIPELQEINRLSSEYTKVIASAKILFHGEICNLSQLTKYAQDLDRKTRQEAALAQAKFFEDNEKIIGDIYDKLVHLRNECAIKLGYKNFVELGYYSLGRTDYDAEMVKNYREQIYKDLVPITNKLFSAQMKRIEVNDPLWFDYNLCFKDGNASPKGNKDYLVIKAQEMYHELSKETDDFFRLMNENNLMDLETKKGKAPGGFMTYIPKYKVPFIFSNFNGTSGDVDVLTHEFGHAFQGYMSRNIKCPFYRSPTLEACEIHSMSMEFLTHPWMSYFFKEDTNKYLYSHTADAIQFIPYGVTIDEFQHFVYENPNITHEERCAKFREIEKKYLPHKKYDGAPIFEKGGWWMKQSHVFGSPFYYIDYTLAQVVAFEFFNEDRKNHEKTWKKYVKLCKLGGKYPFTELLKRAKLYNPFIDGTVKKIVNPLYKYLMSIEI